MGLLIVADAAAIVDEVKVKVLLAMVLMLLCGWWMVGVQCACARAR